MNVIAIWTQRIEAARVIAAGLKYTYQTTLSAQNTENHKYHERKGQEVEIIKLVTDGTVCEFDEESLPFFTGRFNDGAELLITGEELHTQDARLQELLDSVNAGFAISRDVGFDGPYHLDAKGTDTEKARFAEAVLTFTPPRASQTSVEVAAEPLHVIDPTMATAKKMRINLVAITRVEYSEVLEVPANITDGELERLISQRYKDVDGSLFEDDPEYWERGHCSAEGVDQGEVASGIVTLNDGKIAFRKNTDVRKDVVDEVVAHVMKLSGKYEFNPHLDSAREMIEQSNELLSLHMNEEEISEASDRLLAEV